MLGLLLIRIVGLWTLAGRLICSSFKVRLKAQFGRYRLYRLPLQHSGPD